MCEDLPLFGIPCLNASLSLARSSFLIIPISYGLLWLVYRFYFYPSMFPLSWPISGLLSFSALTLFYINSEVFCIWLHILSWCLLSQATDSEDCTCSPPSGRHNTTWAILLIECAVLCTFHEAELHMVHRASPCLWFQCVCVSPPQCGPFYWLVALNPFSLTV